ncbi:hypothetical protein [Prosthecobacter sp.]|uniref:hypothetical protein n=1 Tax=Prosthecobacter sp. TaxID=1965333 RepID=UPI003784364C
MTPSRILFLLLITGVCALAGAGLGAWRQTLQVVQRPQEFGSLAKIVAGGQFNSDGTAQWREQQEDFYGTIMETLESGEMKRRALERVRALNPDVKDCDVEIRVARTKGSAIFNILATGAEPKYTRLFLDALLDEFIGFRQNIREQAQGKGLQQFLQAVVTQQKNMEDSVAALEKVRAKADSVSAKSDLDRLITRLTSLRNRRDDLRLEIKSLDAKDAARQPLEAKMTPLEEEIKVIETELGRHEADRSELRMVTEKLERSKALYDKMFEQVETIQSHLNASPDYVAVQERATPAFENVEDWKQPLAIGAGGGGLAGGLIGLLLSLVIVWPRERQTPEPN